MYVYQLRNIQNFSYIIFNSCLLHSFILRKNTYTMRPQVKCRLYVFLRKIYTSAINTNTKKITYVKFCIP